MVDQGFSASPGRPDPQPTIGKLILTHDDSDTDHIQTQTSDCAHETSATSFASPLPIPTTVDLRLFWPLDSRGRLYGPLDLTNPCHRDALWSEIADSIERSDIWMDVFDQRSERGEYEPAHYLALKTEAEKLRRYKRQCMQALEAMERVR